MDKLCFIALDVETTGLDDACEIIEIAMVKYQGGKQLDRWQSLIRPVFALPQNIIELTGITEAMLKDQPIWSEVHQDVLNFLEDTQVDFLVGHNVSFDKKFIERSLNQSLSKKWVDTYGLAKIFLPQLSSYTLSSLAQYFNLTTKPLHRAENDALQTAKILLELIKIITNLSPELLNQLISILGPENDFFLVDFLQICQSQALTNFVFEEKLANHDDRQLEKASDYVLDLAEAEDLLMPEGLMSQANSDFEYRPDQVQMLRYIIKCFEESKHGLLEGGTGIGKSFAYLIPAIYWSHEKETKVLIATNTIALQEQLFNKDLPFLEKVIGAEISAALIKGRNNYICLRRYQRLRSTEGSRIFLARIYYWLEHTIRGDREELNLNVHDQELWSQIANQQETCLGAKCSYYHHQCYFFKNKKIAEKSDVLITNHALLLQDIKNENKVLPQYDYCIIDEAHNLDDEATKQFSEILDFYQLQRWCTNLTKVNNSGLLDGLTKRINLFYEAEDLIVLATDLKEDLVQINRDIEKLTTNIPVFLQGEIRITSTERKKDWWLKLADQLQIIFGSLTKINLKLFQIINELEIESTFEELLKELVFHKTKIMDFRNNLEEFLEGQNENLVYWLNIANSFQFKNIRLNITPLNTYDILNELLFEMKQSVILTSATLTIANNFKYLVDQYGLKDKHYSFRAPSPFDYEEQSIILIPNDLPEPSLNNDHIFIEEITHTIIELLPEIKGGVLILFTSYNMLNRVYSELKSSKRLNGKTILAHGKDGNRNYIIENMQNNRETIVLGTNSFWEGIDVKGEHLSSVIITKLPFLPPARPVVAARLENLQKQGLNSFSKYSLPKAVLKFRQGYGRLIRSKNEKGSVIILDKRVIGKRYGSEFLKSLPTQTIHINPLEKIKLTLSKWYQKEE